MKLRANPFLVLGVLMLFCAQDLWAVEVCSSLASISDSKSALRVKNCEAAYKEVGNKEAFTYTMKYFKDNYLKLADSSCAEQSSSLKRGILNRGKVEAGIRNGCTMVINDLKSSYKGASTRSNAYFIDLCASTPQKSVTKFFMNKGTGTARRGYADSSGAKTSLAGAFLTDNKVQKFNPYKMNRKYAQIKRQMGGRLPALRLVGLNASNNSSEYSKPIHASPYNSSWGCPSVSPQNAWVMDKLAASGPSLLMSYGNSSLHQSTTSCHNQSAPARKSSAKHSKKSGSK